MRREAQGIPEYAAHCCQRTAASRRITRVGPVAFRRLLLAAFWCDTGGIALTPDPRLRTPVTVTGAVQRAPRARVVVPVERGSEASREHA